MELVIIDHVIFSICRYFVEPTNSDTNLL